MIRNLQLDEVFALIRRGEKNVRFIWRRNKQKVPTSFNQSWSINSIFKITFFFNITLQLYTQVSLSGTDEHTLLLHNFDSSSSSCSSTFALVREHVALSKSYQSIIAKNK